MAKTDCIWNKDLENFPNACVWKQPMQECYGKCDSYDTDAWHERSTLKGTEKTSCPDCSEEEEETLP